MPQPHPFSAIVNLPRDDLPRDDEADRVHEPTAHGGLHWAPHHDPGYSARMQALAKWVAEARPDVCVVDVSVEVAIFLRLLGVPVVVVTQPGERTDPPHDVVYRIADHIVAPWPRELNAPHWLGRHADKTSYVGGISRFEGRGRIDDRRCGPDDLDVLLLGGAGGGFDAAAPESGASRITWRSLGGGSGTWVEDPWEAICTADVVVTHAGQNSVADAAAARRPAVVIPQPRPFDEQHATAEVLTRHRLAVTASAWPADDEWPRLLARARETDPSRWERWQVDGAAARAAAAIESTAERCRGQAP